LLETAWVPGKADVDALRPDLADALRTIQARYNIGLRGKLNNPDHAGMPPFHLDYVDSSVENALAFSDECYCFIGVTVPLVQRMWGLSLRLGASERVERIIGVPRGSEAPISLAILRVTLNFVVFHEYAHHVCGHLDRWPSTRSVTAIDPAAWRFRPWRSTQTSTPRYG
jgi:hypothetical protein